jgi:hypothetical protein
LKGDKYMIEYEIATGEVILIDESSDEHAALFHTTGYEEYLQFMASLDELE